jgi:hypothetical protein
MKLHRSGDDEIPDIPRKLGSPSSEEIEYRFSELSSVYAIIRQEKMNKVLEESRLFLDSEDMRRVGVV